MRYTIVIAVLGVVCSLSLGAEPGDDKAKAAPAEATDPAAAPAVAVDAARREIESYRERALDLIAEALENGGAYHALESLCKAAPHRLSGSPGAAAAVEWARQEMERAGLENVRLEDVQVPHWVRGDVATLRFASPPELAGESLPILALGGSVATPPGGVQGTCIEVTSLDELAENAARVKGNIVFFNRPLDRSLLDTGDAYGGVAFQRYRGAAAAGRLGAIAVITRSLTTRVDDLPHTGGMAYEDGVPQIPAAAVSTRGAEKLSALLAAGKEVSLVFEQNCATLPDKLSHNVIGELKGREHPEEIVVVGGHLDAWDVGQGASDDGAGCVQSIEVVRLLNRFKMRPRRTIRVVLFMNEENGLGGGKTYYKNHKDAMANHVLAIETDRGGFTPRGFTTDANPEAMATLREIARLLEDAGAGVVKEGGGGADISAMTESGVVTMGYMPDGHRYFDIHHTTEDTIDKVNERELNLGAACIATMAYVVADLEHRLPPNPPKPKDAAKPPEPEKPKKP